MRLVDRRWLAFAMAAVFSSTAAFAQFFSPDPEWRESKVPPPPAFDVKRLLFVESPVASSLKFGIDPDTLVITPDGVVRYVMAALGPTGAQNVFYEGIRCNTGEYRVYARHNPESGWSTVADSEWRSIKGSAATRHALSFALSAVCTGAAPTSPVSAIVHALRTGVAPGMTQ